MSELHATSAKIARNGYLPLSTLSRFVALATPSGMPPGITSKAAAFVNRSSLRIYRLHGSPRKNVDALLFGKRFPRLLERKSGGPQSARISTQFGGDEAYRLEGLFICSLSGRLEGRAEQHITDV